MELGEIELDVPGDIVPLGKMLFVVGMEVSRDVICGRKVDEEVVFG